MLHSLSPTPRRSPWLAVPLVLLTVGHATAQEGYRQPPSPISQILDARPTPGIDISPDHTRILFLDRRSLPSIAEVAAPELGLAGTRINPKTNGPSRSPGLAGLRIRELEGKDEIKIETPVGGRIGSASWALDGKSIAFTITTDDGIALWVADPSTGKAKALTPPRLNAASGRPFIWMPGDKALLCAMVPPDRVAPPAASGTPTGPVVQQSEGRAAPNRTYQDLLTSPVDEALFEYYFTCQLAVVTLDGELRPIGKPGIHGSFDLSPDGRYLLVETIHRPFSYLVPSGRFPTRVEVWDLDGKVVHTLVDRPLQEEVPIAFDATVPGPRSANWRADAPATLVWVEALDGGDPAKPAPKRDVLRSLPAPFDAKPVDLASVEFRFGGVTWGRGDLAMVTERWRKTRKARTWAIQPHKPDAEPKLVFDRSSEDRYGDPGRFVTKLGPLGTRVLLTADEGKTAFLAGTGASPEGDRPFFDKVDLASGKTTRLFRSEAPYYEMPVEPLNDAATQICTVRESVDEPPNYFRRDLAAGTLTKLTDFPDPAPQLAGLKGELIRYKRADGVELSAKLYLPPGYKPSQGPIPFLLWAYPEEFKSAAAASQVSGSPYEFTRPGGISHLFMLTQGYGILDGPSMPIVGVGDAEPNDTYIEQLVSSAKAAVDAIVERGLADRGKIAVGGHSYGAFMTANLLAHSDLFAAGIARSGAYNRSLTPFGFQSEERPFWEVREIYNRMSPFTYADRLKTPILMIHGQADNNSGTFPIQSERMYAAIKGNGGTARLVLLPAESHGYQARESVGHTLWEMSAWLEKYVKSGSGQSAGTRPTGGGR